MKAVAVQAFGSPGGMAVIDLTTPVPTGRQVLVTVEATGVGGVDVVIRRGDLAAYGFREGHVLGSEVAGIVTAVGDDVDTSWIGRRVWASRGLGGGTAEEFGRLFELAGLRLHRIVSARGPLSVVEAVAV